MIIVFQIGAECLVMYQPNLVSTIIPSGWPKDNQEVISLAGGCIAALTGEPLLSSMNAAALEEPETTVGFFVVFFLCVCASVQPSNKPALCSSLQLELSIFIWK